MELNRTALRVIRELSGHSQSSLARASGVSQGHISQLESGDKRASPRTITRLARTLKVPLTALVIGPADSEDAVFGGQSALVDVTLGRIPMNGN